MIDEYNNDRTGWARFSDDRTMRYRLARSLDGRALTIDDAGRVALVGDQQPIRVVFLMLNPSTADAFKPDPTVGECIKRARGELADVLEVVNLFALRSPYPKDLRKCAHGFRGDDVENNQQIMAACADAFRVIAAWGNDGVLGGRERLVRNMFASAGIQLHHLGTTQDGFPKHPLARGKHRIAADLQPIAWSAP